MERSDLIPAKGAMETGFLLVYDTEGWNPEPQACYAKTLPLNQDPAQEGSFVFDGAMEPPAFPIAQKGDLHRDSVKAS